MTATDELRRMLTEAGVEWKAWNGVHPITVWRDETYLYEFVEYGLINDAKQVSDCPSNNDGYCELTIKVFNCTPEQAVEATLGRGTCHKTLDFDGAAWICSECGEHIGPRRWNFCPNCGRKVVGE